MIAKLAFISSIALAQLHGEGKSVFGLQEEKRSEEHTSAVNREPSTLSAPGERPSKNATKAKNPPMHSDLITHTKPFESAQSPFVNFKGSPEKIPELVRSSMLIARINDGIIAYEGSKEVVRAVVSEGQFKGSVLFGNATMDKATKNAVITFDTFISSDRKKTFKFLASVKTEDGFTGIPGEVKSDYKSHFITQVILDTVSAAADATTQKTPTINGGYNAVPGPDSTFRQGIAGGASKVAERLSEKNNQIHEYVQVEGPVYIRVYVNEQPEKI